MKNFCLLLLAVIATALFAETTVVCEDGVCRIEPAEPAKPAVPPADNFKVVCEDGVCRIEAVPAAETSVSAPDTSFELDRKLLGFVRAPEFLSFLKGETAPETSAGFWGMLLLALLGGIALNLTPCVLPMLPINLAVIGASGGKNGFRQGLLYGCGMAAAYGVLGLLAAFAGVSFGTLNSSPLFNFAIAVIFLIMSLAMAGVFNVDLAAKWRISPKTLPFSRELTALFMGGISALLAGACVAPVVITVLIFAANTVQQGYWYGALIPFFLGIGMALPWPLAGAGLSILPRPGKFMVYLKYLFALLIFAAAGYYTYLGIKLLPQDQVSELQDGFTALREAEKLSASSGKPILVKFTASWCKNCHEMDRSILRDPEVAEYIKTHFIPVTFPAENPADPAIKEILQQYDIPGFPAFVILKSPES